jgi:hypothetical protein
MAKTGRPPLEPRIKALEELFIANNPVNKQGTTQRIAALESRIAELEAARERGAEVMRNAGVKAFNEAASELLYKPLFDRWPGNGS